MGKQSRRQSYSHCTPMRPGKAGGEGQARGQVGTRPGRDLSCCHFQYFVIFEAIRGNTYYRTGGTERGRVKSRLKGKKGKKNTQTHLPHQKAHRLTSSCVSSAGRLFSTPSAPVTTKSHQCPLGSQRPQLSSHAPYEPVLTAALEDWPRFISDLLCPPRPPWPHQPHGAPPTPSGAPASGPWHKLFPLSGTRPRPPVF